jgi:phospholipid transport system substrate-binding protein
VKYQMGQYKDGSWRLRNLIIENINLGEIYRGQFAAAADSAEGNLDLVIDTWDDSQIRARAEEG